MIFLLILPVGTGPRRLIVLTQLKFQKQKFCFIINSDRRNQNNYLQNDPYQEKGKEQGHQNETGHRTETDHRSETQGQDVRDQ